MSDVSQWSTSAASNTSAPPDGAPEGMAPSTVNDVLREIQAAVARWYSDSDGTLETAGSGNSYTLTTNSTHAALADIPLLVFRVDRANTGAATLNVDGLGAKSMRVNGGALASGQLVADTVVIAAYNATDDAYDLFGVPANDAALLTTGELPDARLSSNVPLKDASNTFTVTQTIEAAVAPQLWFESDNASVDANGGVWGLESRWISGSAEFNIHTRADDGTFGNRAINIERSGTTVTEINLTATSITANGSEVLTEATGAQLDAANTFLNTVTVSDTAPRYRWTETDAGTDEQRWRAIVDNGTWRIETLTDAGLAGEIPIIITRSGVEVTELDLAGDSVTVNGSEVLTEADEGAGNGLDADTVDGIEAAALRDATVNTQNGNYTLVLGDSGKSIVKTSGGAGETITIPANASVAFPTGTMVTFVNLGGGDLSIAITSDTLRLAGTTTDGTRTLVTGGVATAIKVTSTFWVISGAGLS